jgi:FixJ family two-component response regulator
MLSARGTLHERLVVVVDDDPAVVHSLKFALEVEGFVVLPFLSAEDFLAETGQAEPACILIDYHLPAIDGLALVAELRRRHARYPAILLTSHPSPLVRARAAEARMTVLEKPFFGKDVARTVKHAIESRAAPEPR